MPIISGKSKLINTDSRHSKYKLIVVYILHLYIKCDRSEGTLNLFTGKIFIAFLNPLVCIVDH